jgi:hypothetical protein
VEPSTGANARHPPGAGWIRADRDRISGSFAAIFGGAKYVYGGTKYVFGFVETVFSGYETIFGGDTADYGGSKTVFGGVDTNFFGAETVFGGGETVPFEKDTIFVATETVLPTVNMSATGIDLSGRNGGSPGRLASPRRRVIYTAARPGESIKDNAEKDRPEFAAWLRACLASPWSTACTRPWRAAGSCASRSCYRRARRGCPCPCRRC